MSDDRRTCPQCGADEAPDGALSCACEPEEAEEAEEAEAFAPLRVRPYVSLSEPSQPAPPRAADPYAYPPPPRLTAQEADDGAGPAPDKPSRGGRILLLAAVTGVLSVATLVTVLISSPGDDDASASDNTAATATALTPAPPSPTRSVSPSSTKHSPSPTPTPTPTPSRTASVSPTPTHTKPSTKPQKREPSRPPSSPTRSASSTPTPPPTLRRGDRGHEVTELQYRLKRLSIYAGDTNGHFNSPTETAVSTYQMSRGIQDDKRGEYGPATRTALERETGN
ncbi:MULTISPECIES: peptidoglycan-binding protein [unclassified Streptomyces]|uniref:peptidoglycan-binding domain-containing protein n=1 Tax=unclassified Streptomyces TaxID=2593676 RepID=UPI00278C11B9|nr:MULTISPECIES: peptidoglycan-binding domain-containing protein [unclassified Streptomyces]